MIAAGEGFLNGFGGEPHRNGFNGGLRLHRQKAVGDVAQPFDVGAKILRVAFYQPRDFNGDRIAGVGVGERGHDFGFREAGR